MTPLSTGDPAHLGVDPLDVAPVETVFDLTPKRRSQVSWAHGWSAASIPVAVLLMVGIAFGPMGIGFLSPDVLQFLDPAMPVALAVLGVLVGLGTSIRPRDHRLLGAAGVEAGVTAVVITAAAVVIARASALSWTIAPWLMGLTAGICAATSLSVQPSSSETANTPGARLVEAQIVLAILAGGLVLAAVRGTSPLTTILLASQACAVVLVLATAGWLLLSAAASGTEPRVFAIAALLLVGGAADYLSWSALMSGLVAGLFWQWVGGQTRDFIERDAIHVQRPLAVLVLIVAGARADPSAVAAGLALLYAVLRGTGSLAGRALARRMRPSAEHGGPQLPVLPPGVFGVALALNAVRAAGPDMTTVLTVVVLGTIVTDLAAGLGRRSDTPA